MIIQSTILMSKDIGKVKRYREPKKNKERNVVQCNVQEKRRDAIATSVRIASEVVGSSTSYLQHNDKDPNYELARNYIPIDDE